MVGSWLAPQRYSHSLYIGNICSEPDQRCGTSHGWGPKNRPQRHKHYAVFLWKVFRIYYPDMKNIQIDLNLWSDMSYQSIFMFFNVIDMLSLYLLESALECTDKTVHVLWRTHIYMLSYNINQISTRLLTGTNGWTPRWRDRQTVYPVHSLHSSVCYIDMDDLVHNCS